MLNVKHILWDVDGTLYKYTSQYMKEMKREIYETFSKKLGITLQRAKTIFERELKILGAGTEVFLKHNLDPSLAMEAINRVDKKRVLKRDPSLLNMLKNTLKNYDHIIVTGTTRKDAVNTLKILGIPKNIFSIIITLDDVALPKPRPEPYLKTLQFTKDRPERHVAVGDSEKRDIIPAKNLGMKTVIVGKKSKIADYSIDSIYDLPKLLHADNILRKRRAVTNL